jgi:ribose 5-phosphate isomerase B
MKIAIGSDHAGFETKEKVKVILRALAHEVEDMGTDGKDSVDYPDFAIRVARAVSNHEADRGVAVCMTGAGMTIVANKVKEVRAALCLNEDMARMARAHNDANVLTLAQKYVPDAELEKIIKTWLDTEFEGGRHERRIKKIEELESQW